MTANDGGRPPTVSPTLAGTTRRATAWAKVTVMLTLLGALLGLAWFYRTPPVYVAQARVLAPPIPLYPAFDEPPERIRPVSQDTEAQIATSTPVLQRVANVLPGRPSVAEVRRDASVTVPTSSVVIVLSYAAHNARTAQVAANTWAAAYIDSRRYLLNVVRSQQVERNEKQIASLRQELRALTNYARSISQASPRRAAVRQRRLTLSSQLNALEVRVQTLQLSTLTPGELLRAAPLKQRPERANLPVPVTSGALVGFLGALGAGEWLNRRYVQQAGTVLVSGREVRQAWTVPAAGAALSTGRGCPHVVIVPLRAGARPGALTSVSRELTAVLVPLDPIEPDFPPTAPLPRQSRPLETGPGTVVLERRPSSCVTVDSGDGVVDWTRVTGVVLLTAEVHVRRDLLQRRLAELPDVGRVVLLRLPATETGRGRLLQFHFRGRK